MTQRGGTRMTEERKANTMKKMALVLSVCLFAGMASATVEISVQNVDGMAEIHYTATEGESISAFALDVTVDTGTITGISGFIRGESTAQNPGYGIFPASFAAAITVDPDSGEVNDWNIAGYTPLANPDDPGALGGLNTPGVTLEMGALYADSADAPGPEGLLCKLSISEAATVSVALNEVRGGIVLTDATRAADPVLGSAMVTP